MLKTAVIVAGGSGKRMGSELPKQFLPLQNKPILIHTVERFLNFHQDLKVVLVLPEAHFPIWHEISQEFLDVASQKRVACCAGGETRTESVFAGLEKLNSLVEDASLSLVAIHDGVRPFLKQEILENAFRLAAENGASVVCVPVKSSIRERIGPNQSKAVDRSRFFHVQTPQTFRLSEILKAFKKRPHNLFTDDASLYDDYGGQVVICEGSYDNVKITTPEDIALGESILKRAGE